jgi:hypothetical protein
MSKYLVALAALAAGSAAHAQISFTGLYSQNFDTLPASASNVTGAAGGSPAWVNDTTLDGWFAGSTSTWVDGIAISNGGLSPTLGANSTNGVASFGSFSSTDRALAPVRRNGGTSYVALRLTNNTGSTLTSLDVSFTGEQWRSNNAAADLAFAFSVDPLATINSGTYTAAAAFNFAAPLGAGSAANTALDGNASANRTAISNTLSGLNLANGQDIWLRWAFAGNNAVNLAIDDLVVSAQIPEPSAFATLAGLGSLGLVAMRRRRSS